MKSRIHCDVMIGGSLHGWAFAEHAQFERERTAVEAVEIGLGAVVIGRRRPDILRPDIDKASATRTSPRDSRFRPWPPP